jgi:hypothetical protein
MVSLNIINEQQNNDILTYKYFVSSQYVNIKNVLQLDKTLDVLNGIAKSWKNHKRYPHLSI